MLTTNAMVVSSAWLLWAVGLLSAQPVLLLIALAMATTCAIPTGETLARCFPAGFALAFAALTMAGVALAWVDVHLDPRLLHLTVLALASAGAWRKQGETRVWDRWDFALIPPLAAGGGLFFVAVTGAAPSFDWLFHGIDQTAHFAMVRVHEHSSGVDYANHVYPRGFHWSVGTAVGGVCRDGQPFDILDHDTAWVYTDCSPADSLRFYASSWVLLWSIGALAAASVAASLVRQRQPSLAASVAAAAAATALLISPAFTREPMTFGFWSAQAAVTALLASGCAALYVRGNHARALTLSLLLILMFHTYLTVTPFVLVLTTLAVLPLLRSTRGFVFSACLGLAVIIWSLPSVQAVLRLGTGHINALGGIADTHHALFVGAGAGAILATVALRTRDALGYALACAALLAVAARVVGENLATSGQVTYYGTKSLWFLVASLIPLTGAFIGGAVGCARTRARRTVGAAAISITLLGAAWAAAFGITNPTVEPVATPHAPMVVSALTVAGERDLRWDNLVVWGGPFVAGDFFATSWLTTFGHNTPERELVRERLIGALEAVPICELLRVRPGTTVLVPDAAMAAQWPCSSTASVVVMDD